MKKILLLACLVTMYSHTIAQTKENQTLILPQKDSTIYYEGVVKVDSSFTKNQLYSKAKVWFIDYFKNAKAVIQLDDKEEGQLIGKGVLSYTYEHFLSIIPVYVECTIVVSVKDGRYKYQIYNIKGKETLDKDISDVNFNIDYYAYKNNKSFKKWNFKILNGMNNEVVALLLSLEKAMKNSSSSDF